MLAKQLSRSQDQFHRLKTGDLGVRKPQDSLSIRHAGVQEALKQKTWGYCKEKQEKWESSTNSTPCHLMQNQGGLGIGHAQGSETTNAS